MKIKKIIVVISVFFVMFSSNPAAAWSYKGCLLAMGGVVSSVLYGVLYYPYNIKPNTPSSSVAITPFSNLCSNSTVNLKQYDDVPTIASHNSFTYPYKSSVLSFGISQTVLAQNQVLNNVEQLNYGVRTFLIDIYDTNKNDPNATIKFSHGFYKKLGILELGFFVKDWMPFLKEIENFLSTNPDEIITFHLESYVENYNKIMRDLRSAKLDTYLYNIASNSTNWDTRAQIIASGKRLLIFSDKKNDCGPGIMYTNEYVLENHYEDKAAQCTYRDFSRLKIPEYCIQNNMDIYQCTKSNMVPISMNGNKGAIVFVMNHFASPTAVVQKFRILFPSRVDDVIKEYYSWLNSYNVIKNKIEECYCELEIPNGTTLQTATGLFTPNTLPTKKMKLKAYPHAIALDFVGEKPNNASNVEKIIEEIISGSFVTSKC